MKDSIGLKLSSLLFLSGYSQGGHASMATLKQMEEKHAGEFMVTAAAPMSGAYNMGGEQEKNMHRVYAYPIYLPYLILGYQEAYKIYPGNILEMFQPPYDSIVSKVFIKEDTCNLYFANALLPSIPNQMIRKEFLQMYQDNPNHPIKTAISKNNVYDWKPESPLMLLYSKGDEQVAYQCSIDAYHAMTKRGAKNVHLRKVSNRLGHEQTAGFAFIYTKFWFDSFRDNPKTKTGKYGPWWKRTAMSMVKMVTPK
jgi:hypothetical protein